MNFTHLHVHTEYSLLDGSNKIREYVARVKELGMTSAAITDHGAMFGVIDFYRECQKQGIRPVIGCEVYVAVGSRFDKNLAQHEGRYYHLLLLAENNTGYQNLMKLVSRGYTEGFYYRPRVDRELLAEYHEGIIALSACLAGEVPRLLEENRYEDAKKAALEHQEIFGKGNYFLEMQDHGIPEQQTVNQGLMRMSQETGIELVATNDIHYTYADDAKPHDILICLQTNKHLSDENRMRYTGGQYYVKSPEEMAEIFPYAPQALENTQKIADRCHVEFTFGEKKIPHFDVPEGKDGWTYLNELCSAGLERRYDPVTPELKDRLDFELETIRSMGFVDYFLIVWDFIRFAKENGIAVGPGRGSAAGSMVSYCLGITDIDPIRYQLFFERFLNPERVTMPDIDVDFCYVRRQEVIDYVVEKYGRTQVSQIGTFGTLLARGVIRDVGRVMDLPYAMCDKIAKMIPAELGITLDRALTVNPELRELYENDEQVHELIDMSRRLEGLPRHVSMHAAGVVISQKPVEEYVPLALGADGATITQFSMTTLEELGLLKMDFLGLKTLTVIQNAARMAAENDPDLTRMANRSDAAADARIITNPDGSRMIDMNAVELDDPAVYDMLCAGDTAGIFQLESAGMTSFMKELQPRSIDDIIAGIALYRPGPMDFIPQYVAGKKNPKQIQYDTPQLEPILRSTYGCIVYQEQVMQIVQSLAGYTLGRSDLLRRAMSKKKGDVMEQERQNFVYGDPENGIPGCAGNGIDEKIAHKIYDEMIDFAKYAFNKSHAAAYAIVSFQTAWLKCHYPVEFMAALMTSVMDNSTKVAGYMYNCRQMGISILPPDVEAGRENFDAKDGHILYGLAAIRGVGTTSVQQIAKERQAHGPYTDLKDFLERTGELEVNKRVVENLIKAGALDALPGNRRQKMTVYAQLMEQIHKSKKISLAGQMSLMDLMGEGDRQKMAVTFPRVTEYERSQLLAMEKEVLSIYISGHPLEDYADEWKKRATAISTDFKNTASAGDADEAAGYTAGQNGRLFDGQRVLVGGIISEKRIKYTKNNQIMAYIILEDMVGSFEAIVFPKSYDRYKDLLEEDQIVWMQGRVSTDDERDSQLICESVSPIECENSRELWIRFDDREAYEAQETYLRDVVFRRPGNDMMVIYLKKEKAVKRCTREGGIRADETTLTELRARLGAENIAVKEMKG